MKAKVTAKCPPKPQTIDDPITGEIVDLTDVDALAEAWQRSGVTSQALYAFRDRIKQACQELALPVKTPDSKTCRIVGEDGARIKVVFPSDGWDNKTLKQIWEQFPDYAPTYLKIAEVSPIYAVMRGLPTTTSKDKDFMAFRKAALAANLGPVGLPSIEVEVVKSDSAFRMES